MELELHGVLSEAAGRERMELGVAPGERVADVLERLGAEVPELVPHLARVACAVGDTLVPRATVLEGNERLALLPPVSGG
ncbi:hypothetical protein KBTX_04369 [wastewater metagenome]|uniref:Molybdopterin synthase sulfur carrier subunit n=2 Tax=unclassified sequences TaxID=12908 RepID=A0A5B8RH84_9ZZZZ|nr:hypothetical protein KBTEX_04369 [uncultured organism]